MKDQITAVRDLLLEVLGPWRPTSAQPLTLVPLFGKAPGPDYLLAARAINDGLLTITELDSGASVPQLMANNQAQLPVLLVDGEHLEGAKQNRVMNASALLAPHHKTVLPVSCVEQGRWSYEEENTRFEASPDFSYTRLRARNRADVVQSVRSSATRHVDQGAVWEDVEDKMTEFDAHSPTGAMAASFESRRSQIDEIIAANPTPEEGQTGVLVCIGGRVIALDLFDKPETLAEIWPRLVSGYAVDALGEKPAEITEETVKRFLADAVSAEASLHQGIGLGFDIALTGNDTVGNALVFEDRVIHLSVFPNNDLDSSEGPPSGSRIERPRRRARPTNRIY